MAVVATTGIWATLVRGGRDAGGDAQKQAGAGVSEPVQALVARMSPAERVDQILLLGFSGSDSTSPVFPVLRSHQVGGLVIRSENWLDMSQGRQLIADLRATGLAGRRVPPLIATQQGGGRYRSLGDMPPSTEELDLGERGSPQLAQAWARDAGRALRGAGFDLDLFPVADVAAPDSPLAGQAFSDDPAVAAELAAAALRGCNDARIACAPLHFPGLGAASQDTDQGPATVSLDPGTLASRDLPAFRAAFKEHAPAVVLSLAFYAAYDPVTQGALAPQIDTGLLRRQLGYEGAAITDDLDAGAIKATSKAPDAAVAAVRAGADMVQIGSPADQAAVRAALLRAVGDGEIPQVRLDEAAGRVLELKRHVGLLKGNIG